MSKKAVAQRGVDDLVMLPKITEGEILDNTKTTIGPVLVAVNPYKDLGQTGDEYVDMYRGKHAHEVPPHIFALAEEAYREMKNEKENQCVLISGESGAGKTVSAKLIMQFIAAVTGRSEQVEYVKSVILDSNPLLEAFGNAKTLRNNNSSRFGKYFEIQFNLGGDPCGGKVTTYLLEKSRVVAQGQGERSFHIFYNLLAGADQNLANQLSLYGPENFFYLNTSGCYTVDDMNDSQDYQEVRKAMTTLGMDHGIQEQIIQLVACILHLGNIQFYEDGSGNSAPQDQQALDLAANLLQVDSASLSSAICFRVINTGGAGGGRRSTYNVPANPAQAAAARDSLSKAIYDRVFSYLVECVNIALDRYHQEFQNVIGILDIYGFEIFGKNGFEQFCINFVNEKLQQYFIELTLKAEQEEYVAEGIQWTPIKYFNNQIVCDLMEGKNPPGIFSLLDDVCHTSHAEDSSVVDGKFIEKMSGMHSGHLHWRGFSGGFEVKHYAGEVAYAGDGFTEKNKDTLYADLIETMQISGNSFLVSLFPEDTKQDQRKRPTTSGFKIKSSCGQLMNTLSQCSPHYIRCIKPNETKKPRDWDSGMCKHQVQYLGLLENVKVRRAGFAYRAPFERFVRRYKKLSDQTWGLWGEWTGDMREGCQVILAEVQIANDQWQMGQTKLFIRHPETLFHLEECIERKDYEHCVVIQKAWRQWKAKRHALEQKALAADMFKDKKERQRLSVERKYEGDYLNYETNFGLQEVLGEWKGEMVLFADEVSKLNRKYKPEKRTLLVTETAFYIIVKAIKKKQVIYNLTRRVLLKNLSKISVSTLADNYIILHVPTEYDNIIETDKKTELATILVEQFEASTQNKLQVVIADQHTYSIKGGKNKSFGFARNEAAANKPQMKKSGKGCLIGVATGLPASTDTTPKGYVKREKRAPPSMGLGGGAAPPPQQQGGGRAMPQQGGGRAQPGGAQPGGRAMPQPQQQGGGRAQPGGGQPGRAMPQPTGGAQPGGGRAMPGMGGAQPNQNRAMPQPTGGAQPGGGRAMPGMGGQQGGGRALPGMGGAQPGGAGRALPGMGAPPKAAPAKPQAKALYDYQGSSAEELSFREGNMLSILQKDAGGWWEAELNGNRGWVPANYVQEV